MKAWVRFVLPVVALILDGCSSAPIHRYTLQAPTTAVRGNEQPVPFLIEVLPVSLPEQLDQPQFVVRQGASGVAILEGERWAAPLGDELRQTLSTELMARLGTRDVAGMAKPAGRSVLRIKLLVRSLDAWPGEKLVLDADWSLSMIDGADSTRLLCHGRFDESALGGYPELVLAGQRAVAALATRMAGDALALARSSPPECAG